MEKEDYENNYIIGKYGHLRLEYLKNHKKAEYTIMFMNKTLRKHIVEIDKQARNRVKMLMKQMLERNHIKRIYLYLKIRLTFANNCFRMYIKFAEIGSDFYL